MGAQRDFRVDRSCATDATPGQQRHRTARATVDQRDRTAEVRANFRAFPFRAIAVAPGAERAGYSFALEQRTASWSDEPEACARPVAAEGAACARCETLASTGADARSTTSPSSWDCACGDLPRKLLRRVRRGCVRSGVSRGRRGSAEVLPPADDGLFDRRVLAAGGEKKRPGPRRKARAEREGRACYWAGGGAGRAWRALAAEAHALY